MTAKTNILEGLHVLLVSEDEARVASLAKALRDRKASVGDVKVRSLDALALRGADLVVIDTRSADSTKAHVNEMRADVRARWASIAQLDYSKLVLDDGTVMLPSLETEVTPLVTADKELTERARTEESFSVSLRPLGPSRMLRALAAAGPTMHVEIFHETLSGSVDLSNELLVCAFAERGTSEKWEAWTALVRILGLLDATVHVSRKSHPSAMNIMEPIDQALEVAAQERHSSAELIAIEERTARARVADDGARTGSHPARRADGSFVKIEPEQLAEPAPMLAAETTAPDKPAVPPPSPKRTLLGVAAPALPDDLPAVAKSRVPSRYSHHAEGSGEKARPSPSRTLLGVAPGALPAFGGMPRPVVNLALPAAMAKVARPEPAPELPIPANNQTNEAQPRPASKHFVDESPTDRHPVMLEVARAAFAASDDDADLPALPARSARNDARTVPMAAVADEEDGPSPLPGTAMEAEREETLVTDPKELRALREESGQHPMVKSPDLMPLDDDLPADLAAAPPSHLLDAIGEEVTAGAFSDPPGAKPIEPAKKAAPESAQTVITRFVRKPRTRNLLLLLLFAVTEYYFVVWNERKSDELLEQRKVFTVASPIPVKRAPEGAPAAAPGTETTQAAAQPAPEAPLAASEVQPAEPPPAPVQAATAVAQPATHPAPAIAQPAAAPTQPAAAPTPAATALATTPAPVAKPAAAQPEPKEPVAAGGVEGLVRAGTKLLDAGNAKDARDEFARAVAGDAKNAHAREGLAEALAALGEHRDALVQIEEAIKLRPRRARYRVVQGDAFQALGKASLAKDAWSKALELDPSDREAKKRLSLQ